jgi:hypothetical protein
MTDGNFPNNKYLFDYEGIEYEKGHLFAPDLETAMEKLEAYFIRNYGELDEQRLTIEEEVW